MREVDRNGVQKVLLSDPYIPDPANSIRVQHAYV
jgi:hypothetical protein